MVRLADGSEVACRLVKPGMMVWTPSGPVAVLCVVRTRIASGRAVLCRIGRLEITPWHPIRVNGSWKFPIELVEPRWSETEAIYSFLLSPESSEPVLNIGGIECITLGHNLLDNPSELPRIIRSTLAEFVVEKVVEHPYFGTRRVIEDLSALPGWTAGVIEFNEGCLERGKDGKRLLMGFRRDKVVGEQVVVC